MSVLLASLESITPILLIILLGYVLQTRGWFLEQFGANLSKLIMNVALPASVFASVLDHLTLGDFAADAAALAAGFGSVALCYAVSFIAVRALKVPRGRRGTLINMFANANTIFIGMPLSIALFGRGSLQYYLLYYIVNTVSTWSLGALLILRDPVEGAEGPGSGGRGALDWKRLLPPPLIAFLASLAFLGLSIPIPRVVGQTLSYLGATVTPLSLLYIGIVLGRAGLGSVRLDRDTLVALAGRFVAAPLTMFVCLYAFSITSDIEFQTLMVQSAIAGLAVLPILANEGGRRRRICHQRRHGQHGAVRGGGSDSDGADRLTSGGSLPAALPTSRAPTSSLQAGGRRELFCPCPPSSRASGPPPILWVPCIRGTVERAIVAAPGWVSVNSGRVASGQAAALPGRDRSA